MQLNGTGQNVVLVPRSPSQAVHTGGALNGLQATAQGSRITLYANVRRLAAVQDGFIPGGNLGLVAREDDHLAASSLRVWGLP
jgi:hypothetical protein